MKRLLLSGLIGLLCLPVCSFAQLLSWTTSFPKDNDNITIVFDASKGNKGLNAYSNTNNIYVHVGVTTNLSTNGGQQWRYVNGATGGSWGSTTPALKATSLGGNKYSYTINNIRAFFGVPAGETIQKIGILFRDANADAGQVKKGANIDGSDMYIPIYTSDVAVRFTEPPFQPTFVPIAEPLVKMVNDNLAVTANSNKPATFNLYLNGTLIKTATNVSNISASTVLTAGGNTTVLVEAIDGVTVSKDSVKLFVNGGVTTAPLPPGVRDGINYLPGNTSVVLVLYAPGKSRVSVIGEFPGNTWTEQTTNQMKRTPDGNYWWLQLDGLTPGTEYAFQYLVDGSLKIADPYTEKVLDPVNDGFITASVYPNLKAYPAGQTGIVSIAQTAPPAYNWKNNSFTAPDKRNLIIYELLVRDFVATHSWQTMIDTISYLQRLGINAVELMPVSEFEGNDSWGYNPSFSFAPDKYYGTKNKLKEFIDSCHSKGIAVIMDVVPNHVYGQSPLAQLYWNSVQNRPAPDNPWLNQMQPHAFGFGDDFNHESAATKYFWKRMFDFWLREYKMDGYRMDFTKGLTQRASNNDALFSAYDQSRIDILRSYGDTIWKNFPSAYIILEHLAATDEEQALQNLGFLLWGGKRENVAFNEATMGYHDGGKSNLSSLVFNSTERGFTNPYLVGYMESHDEERLMYKNITYGNASGNYSVKNDSIALRRMEAASSIFLMVPGPKMIWQFGERGYDKSIFACPDNTIPQPYGNENCKLTPKEPRWQYMQDIKRKRLYDITAALIKLRKTHASMFNSTDMNYNLTGAIKFFKITSADLSALVVANFDVVPATASVSFQSAGTWYDYLSGATIAATGSLQSIPLQPGEYHVYLNKNVVNAVTTPVIDVNVPVNDLFAQVYPNPASPSSVLSVKMPQAGQLRAELQTMQGQVIGQLFSATFTAGEHRISLTDKINKLAPGIYLLKINSNRQHKYIKILIP